MENSYMDATTALMMPTPPLRATKARVKCSKFLGDRHDSHCLFSPKRERALLPYSVLCKAFLRPLSFLNCHCSSRHHESPAQHYTHFLLMTISFCPIHSLVYSQKGQRVTFIAVKNCPAERRSEL